MRVVWDHSIDLFWLSADVIARFSCRRNLKRCCYQYPVSKWLGHLRVVIYQTLDLFFLYLVSVIEQLRPEFKVAQSNLINRDPSSSLGVCFGELIHEEQCLATRATF